MENSKRAFNYEEGHFNCHIFAPIPRDNRDQFFGVMEGMKILHRGQEYWGNYWKPVYKIDDDDSEDFGPHITLLRGHHSIVFHQIKPLYDSLKDEVANFAPFSICLDEFKVFNNFEGTKQFLCLASRHNNTTEQMSTLVQLKQKIDLIVKQFAMQLTPEMETGDTVAHCSIMERLPNKDDDEYLFYELDDIVDLFEQITIESIIVVRIDKVHIKIGCHTYVMPLRGLYSQE